MKIITWTLVSLFTTSVFADLPIYYWDNQEQLLEATDRCRIESMELKKQKFRFTTYYGENKNQTWENLRDYKGRKQSNMANGSLVKIIEGQEKKNYHKVEFVGKNTSAKNVNRWYTSRGNQGYLFYRSLIQMEDMLLKIPMANIPAFEKTILSGSKETYWSIASAKTYFKLSCPEMEKSRDYTIFRVYKDQSLGPEMLVAVSPQETSLFEEFVPVSKYSVNDILPNFLAAYQSIDYVNLEIRSKKDKDSDTGGPERVEVVNTEKKDAQENITATINDVVCVADTINIRDESLKNVLFNAAKGEKVKRFQDWGETTKTAMIGGEEYTFVKVQIAGREETDQTVGWMANRFIKPQEKCTHLNNGRVYIDPNTQITGLDDPKCCEFPTMKQPTHDYSSGMRRFKAGRGGGTRLHAACDLYRFEGEEFLSVAPGTVIKDVEYFYLGTYELQVVHSGGFVVRYGEMKGKTAKDVKGGAKVKMGQKLGKIGQVQLNVRPMLHLEMYDGSQTGPLTNRNNGSKFQRRTDLMDPTKHLQSWEKKSF